MPRPRRLRLACGGAWLLTLLVADSRVPLAQVSTANGGELRFPARGVYRNPNRVLQQYDAISDRTRLGVGIASGAPLSIILKPIVQLNFEAMYSGTVPNAAPDSILMTSRILRLVVTKQQPGTMAPPVVTQEAPSAGAGATGPMFTFLVAPLVDAKGSGASAARSSLASVVMGSKPLVTADDTGIWFHGRRWLATLANVIDMSRKKGESPLTLVSLADTGRFSLDRLPARVRTLLREGLHLTISEDVHRSVMPLGALLQLTNSSEGVKARLGALDFVIQGDELSALQDFASRLGPKEGGAIAGPSAIPPSSSAPVVVTSTATAAVPDTMALAAPMAPPALAQRDTFDIASFAPPAGWERHPRPGFVVFQTSRVQNGGMTWGQILLFASGPTSASPADNFAAEWHRLVAVPLRVNIPPRIETRQRRDGWTVVIGTITAPQPGNPVTSVLYSTSGFGRVMSVLVNATSQEYVEAGARFVEAVSFSTPPAGPVAGGAEPTAAARPNRAPAEGAPTPSPTTSALGDYIYAIPEGWSTTTAAEGVTHAATAKNGELCQITVLRTTASSGDVARDAIDAFIRIFKIDPRENAEYPFPSPSFTHGISGDGWEYFMVQKALTGRVGDYGMPFGRVLAVRLNDRLAVVLTTSKDPQVSFCFGELVHDEWPRFFASLHFKNWIPTGQQALASKLTGDWITASASAGLHYSFAPNGRYSDVAGATYRSRVSPNEVLVTTQGFFGDGSYTIRGNTITFIKDTNRSRPTINWFRLEDVSADVGRTWKEQLCLFDASIGDVCFRRDR